ncbi:hypothetical protein ACFLWB_02890 [Chloroflexota bacterium]
MVALCLNVPSITLKYRDILPKPIQYTPGLKRLQNLLSSAVQIGKDWMTVDLRPGVKV